MSTVPTAIDILQYHRVLPVITIDAVEQAIPLAQALYAGGIQLLEITLRTEAALPAMQALQQHFPDCQLAAGTVTRAEQFAEVQQAGGLLAISPACTSTLAQAALQYDLPLLPGVATPSEVLAARELGFTLVKFFPASLYGGIAALKQFAILFPDMKFCPTGGITEDNLQDYLQLPNVVCVGGSWMVPKSAVREGHWDVIENLAKSAIHRSKL